MEGVPLELNLPLAVSSFSLCEEDVQVHLLGQLLEDRQPIGRNGVGEQQYTGHSSVRQHNNGVPITSPTPGLSSTDGNYLVRTYRALHQRC